MGETQNVGIDVTLVDNFCNSYTLDLAREADITGTKPMLMPENICGCLAVGAALRASNVTLLMRIARLESVVGRVQKPLVYYYSNLAGSLSLLQAMRQCD